mmetsp:Transcript_13328/g.25053  ORF Transcript_13328/g.25053 Transcript_13328/m.25053 type:complete len:259 (+) Transcript_13328:29-805(+)
MEKGEKGLDKLDTIFECSICYEMFNEYRIPMSLPCGHTICAYCVASITTPDDMLACPIDKQGFSASECSKNYSLTEALDAVELLIGKLQTIKIVNPQVKKKLKTLQTSFERRDLQKVHDEENKPAIKPKTYVNCDYEYELDVSYDEDYPTGYNDYYSGYSSSNDSNITDREVYEESKSVEICQHYQKYQTCRYGDRCKYSHDISVEEPAHVPKYPNKVCFRMQSGGYCQFGNNCWYSHSIAESSEDEELETSWQPGWD